MALCDVVGGLVLGDLHARAHVALAVEEEGEGARQALTGDTGGKGQTQNSNIKETSSVTRFTRKIQVNMSIWLNRNFAVVCRSVSGQVGQGSSWDRKLAEQ